MRFTCISTMPTRSLFSNRCYWSTKTKYKNLQDFNHKPINIKEDFKMVCDSYNDFFKHKEYVMHILENKSEFLYLDRPVEIAYFVAKFMKEE